VVELPPPGCVCPQITREENGILVARPRGQRNISRFLPQLLGLGQGRVGAAMWQTPRRDWPRAVEFPQPRPAPGRKYRSYQLFDENYKQSFAFYRFWFDIGRTYHRIPSDVVLNSILNNKPTGSINADYGKLIHTTAHLTVRFASDVEFDRILAPRNAGLQRRLCTRILQIFLSNIWKSCRMWIAVRIGILGAAPRSIFVQTHISSHTGPISDVWRKLPFMITSSSRLSLIQNCTAIRRTRSLSPVPTSGCHV
jgi:hypothetical protein